MHEIFLGLTPGTRVLDLGSRSGSFTPEACPSAFVVRLDMERPSPRSDETFVQADAARLPFPDRSFDVVIANHSLEHMLELDRVLAEIGRVVRLSGSLYVAVPDSTTFSDRLYRWIYHGGGHVNPFRSMAEIHAAIRSHVALTLVGSRVLHTSFGFLERRHFQPRPPRRMWLFGNGQYAVIALLSYLSRWADKIIGTRLSVYGWAMYYGRCDTVIDSQARANVCVRCGSAHPADALRPHLRLWYSCPACGAWNLFTSDLTA